MEWLFGKSKTMKEQVREWTRDLKKQIREIERESNKVLREEITVKNELKKEARAGNKKECLKYAKALLQSQRTREKMAMTKHQLNSVCLNLKTHYATLESTKHIKKSTEIINAMNKLMKVEAVADTCRSMAMEMNKAGIIDEMVQDAFDMMDGEDMEEEAEQEVNKVLYELTQGQLGSIGAATGNLKSKQEIEEEEVSEIKARLEKI